MDTCTASPAAAHPRGPVTTRTLLSQAIRLPCTIWASSSWRSQLCYDQYSSTARVYALKGAELIVYSTAIGSEPDHPGFDSEPLWQNTMTAHAIANGIFVAAVNRTGHEGTVRFYGSSFVCEPTGHVLAQASRNEPAVVMATLDFKTMEFWRRLFPLLEQRQPQTYGQLAQTGGRA
jgi:N-carbamoylputrescine amidase